MGVCLHTILNIGRYIPLRKLYPMQYWPDFYILPARIPYMYTRIVICLKLNFSTVDVHERIPERKNTG